MEESQRLVLAAVDALKQQHKNWGEIGNKARIALIQAQVRSDRQKNEGQDIGISQQTLYRDWIKPI